MDNTIVVEKNKKEEKSVLNSQKPLATVVVLTYKQFDNLQRNLNSIFIQTYDNIEIIISDDGSQNFQKK